MSIILIHNAKIIKVTENCQSGTHPGIKKRYRDIKMEYFGKKSKGK